MHHTFIKNVNIIQLEEEIKQVISDSLLGVSFTPESSKVTIHFNRELSSQEVNELQSTVESHVPETVQNIPLTVTPRQIRIALTLSGISLESIETLISTLPEPDKTISKITWEYSTEIQRHNPLIINLSPLLGLTKQDLDNLFLLASTV